MSICPHISVQLSLDGFPWNLVWGLLWISVEKFKVILKLGKSMGHFMWIPKYFSLLLVTLSHNKSPLFSWNGIRLCKCTEMLHYVYVAYLVVLLSLLCVGLPSGRFLSGFPAYAPHVPSISSPSFLHHNNIGWGIES